MLALQSSVGKGPPQARNQWLETLHAFHNSIFLFQASCLLLLTCSVSLDPSFTHFCVASCVHVRKLRYPILSSLMLPYVNRAYTIPLCTILIYSTTSCYVKFSYVVLCCLVRFVVVFWCMGLYYAMLCFLMLLYVILMLSYGMIWYPIQICVIVCYMMPSCVLINLLS